MEVYKEIRKDIGRIIVLVVLSSFVYNLFDIAIDDTDKDGFNRSGVHLITDYGTGMQYLYRGGALVERLDSNGNHMKKEK